MLGEPFRGIFIGPCTFQRQAVVNIKFKNPPFSNSMILGIVLWPSLLLPLKGSELNDSQGGGS